MKRKKLARAALIVGLVLILGAGALTGYNLITERVAGEERDAILSELNALIPASPQVTAPSGEGGSGDADAAATAAQSQVAGAAVKAKHIHVLPATGEVQVDELPAVRIDNRDYVGRLSMPALGLDLPVLSSWSYPNLKVAPSVYYGSVYTDNFVICAHNYRTHFGTIGNLTIGNRISFTDLEGNVYSYAVAKSEIVQPNATADVISGEYSLTLFTCTLSGRTRQVIRCNLVSINGVSVDE